MDDEAPAPHSRRGFVVRRFINGWVSRNDAESHGGIFSAGFLVRRSRTRAALLVGVAYLLVGRVFAVPATHVRPWRLAAWLVSGAIFAAHIAYGHFELRNAPRVVALHVAFAVAVGAIGLAVAGMIHSLWGGTPLRLAWLLALVVWPAATAVPAFLVAFAASALLERLPRS